jgi:hypothetical protein
LTKLLVATGGAGDTVEVIDLKHPDKICQPLPNFPYGNTGAVGFLHQGSPIICGGAKSGPVRSECYKLDNTQSSWVKYNDMISPRKFFGSVTDTLGTTFVMGGDNIIGDTLDTLERLQANEHQWTTYEPSMLQPLTRFTTVIIPPSTIMAIGGWNFDAFFGLNTTYVHTIGNEHWTKGPDMSIERDMPACAVFTDPDDKRTYVVVAGSYISSKSTELYDVVGDFWRAGPELPDARGSSVLVPFEDSLILVGGIEDNVKMYKLSSIKGPWELMQQELSIPRYPGPVAFLVPDKFC